METWRDKKLILNNPYFILFLLEKLSIYFFPTFTWINIPLWGIVGAPAAVVYSNHLLSAEYSRKICFRMLTLYICYKTENVIDALLIQRLLSFTRCYSDALGYHHAGASQPTMRRIRDELILFSWSRNLTSVSGANELALRKIYATDMNEIVSGNWKMW